MGVIQNLVQELVLLVILAVFLELLLPEGDMRRYVRMVLGLLIIVAVLQAGVGLWNRDLAVDLSWISVGQPDQQTTGEILREGERLWERGQTQALGQYEEGMARQIKALAGLNPQVTVAGVRVRLSDGVSPGAPGRLEEVVLILEDEDLNGETRPVAGSPPVRDAGHTTRLRGIIADFYGLAPEQVVVEYR